MVGVSQTRFPACRSALAGVGHVPTSDDPKLIVDTITDWIVRAYHSTDVG